MGSEKSFLLKLFIFIKSLNIISVIEHSTKQRLEICPEPTRISQKVEPGILTLRGNASARSVAAGVKEVLSGRFGRNPFARLFGGRVRGCPGGT